MRPIEKAIAEYHSSATEHDAAIIIIGNALDNSVLLDLVGSKRRLIEIFNRKAASIADESDREPFRAVQETLLAIAMAILLNDPEVRKRFDDTMANLDAGPDEQD